MILYRIGCDHALCEAEGPWGETAQDAQERAHKAGWQRWPRDPSMTLDLCPDHHQPPAGDTAGNQDDSAR